jgi:hypothetical protein
MNKRGWLASGLLAAAVIGGYLGLLPLLSSLAAGPAWPEPVAQRAASGVVTVTSLSTDEPSGEATSPDSGGSGEVRVDDPPTDPPTEGTGSEGTTPVRAKPNKKASQVTVVVAGGLERVTPKPAIVVRPTNGGSGGGSSSGGSAGGGGGSSAGGGSNGGGSAAPATPASPGPLDDFGAGTPAGDPPSAGDDEASAGG